MNDQLQLLQPKAPSLVSVKHGLCQDVLKAYPDNHFGAMIPPDLWRELTRILGDEAAHWLVVVGIAS